VQRDLTSRTPSVETIADMGNRNTDIDESADDATDHLRLIT